MTASESIRLGLGRARSRSRIMFGFQGASIGVSLVACLALVSYHLDRALAFTTQARSAWLAAFGVAVCVALALALVAPWLRRVPDALVAVWIEKRYPVLGERLLTTVELSQAANAGTSAALAARVADAAALTAQDLNLPAAVPTTGLRKPGIAAAVAVVALLAHALLAPDSFRTWLHRIWAPGADIPVWAATHVSLEPGDSVIARGDSVRLRVIAKGGSPREARLYRRTLAGRTQERVLTRSAAIGGGARFDLALPSVQEDFTYFARVSDGRSNSYRIRVEDRPVVKRVTVTLTYPSYIGRPPTTRETSGADLLAPVGSTADIRVEANKPLRSVDAAQAPGSTARWAVEGSSASGQVRLMRDGSLSLSLTDARGFTSRPDPRYLLRTTVDRPPTARILQPTGDLERSPLGSVRIEAAAADDYGVGGVELVHRSSRHSRTTPLAAQPAPDSRSVRAACRLSLAPLKLREGDLVTYRVDARDRDNVSGPHVGRSAELRIRIVGAAEMRERAEADIEREAAALRRLVAQERRIEERLRNAGGNPAAAQTSASEQRAVAAQTAALRSQIAATADRMAENGIATEGELAQRAALANALGDLARDAMPRASATMAAAAQPGAQQPQTQEQAASAARDIRSELQKLAETTGRPAAPDQLAREAGQLAREQADLAAASADRADSQDATGQKPDDLGRLAQRQADLRERTDTLASRVASAASAADDPALARTAQDFAQRNVGARQEAARKQLAAGRAADAAPLQRESASALQKLANDLASRRDASASPADLEKQSAALGKAADQLTDLSNRQRTVQQATDRTLSREEASRTAAQERDIEKATRALMPALAAAPAAEDSAQRAAGAMSRAEAALSENNTSQASQPARQATRDLLQAAIEAREAARLLEAQAAALQSQREIAALAREERALQSKTQAAQQAAAKDEKAIRERSDALAREQDQILGRAGKAINEMDSATLKWMGWQATRRMEQAREGLWRKDMGPTTRRYQSNAAQTLERLAASLEQQGLSAAMQVAAGTRGSPEQQFANSAGDVRAVREMEAQIRAETGQIESRRASRPDRALADQERNDLGALANAQGEAQWRLREAADRMNEAVGEAQALRTTSERMPAVRDALQRHETGQATQERQSSIISALDRALEQNREALSAAVRRNSQQANTPSRNSRADATPGRREPPVVRSETPMFRIPGAARHRFGGLGEREQQLMQHGKLEKVPPEYRDLVSRYYRALSERR